MRICSALAHDCVQRIDVPGLAALLPGAISCRFADCHHPQRDANLCARCRVDSYGQHITGDHRLIACKVHIHQEAIRGNIAEQVARGGNTVAIQRHGLWATRFYMFNPLAAILEQARYWIIGNGPSTPQAMGGYGWAMVPLAILFAIVVLGYWKFSREAPLIAEEL